jgi:hypothetical protein
MAVGRVQFRKCREAMSSGSITLADIAKRTQVAAVACTRCDRAGRYPIDTLIRRYGREFSIPDLLRVLSQGCPMRESVRDYDLCGIHCPDLANLLR